MRHRHNWLLNSKPILFGLTWRAFFVASRFFLPTFFFSPGLIFTGKTVSAGSVLLDARCKSKSKILAQLHRLRRTAGFNENNSAGFMFACCGRGSVFHDRKADYESKLFRQVFPKTPLTGIFGMGEIGWDCVPGDSPGSSSESSGNDQSSSGAASAQQRKQKGNPATILWSSDELQHQYSTIFVVVSFD